MFHAFLIYARISQGTFCCEEALKFNNIRIEWVLRQSVSSHPRFLFLFFVRPSRYDSSKATEQIRLNEAKSMRIETRR